MRRRTRQATHGDGDVQLGPLSQSLNMPDTLVLDAAGQAKLPEEMQLMQQEQA